MSLYQTPTAHSDSIPRPMCPQCGTQSLLARVDPHESGHEQRTFECFRCLRSETVIVKLK